MQAQTIDEVIAQLDLILAQAERENSPLGYFPALYRRVTVRVKQGIDRGEFADGERMERLDVNFANRYLLAWQQWRAGQPPSRAWERAFAATADGSLVVMQHLALGINAHINLDLGLAAAQTAPGPQIHALKPDFEAINGLLASLVNTVQDQLAQVWPAMRLLDWAGGRLDEGLANFSIKVARVAAWQVALGYAPLTNPAEQAAFVAKVDGLTSHLAERIWHPGWWAGRGFGLVRRGERGSPAQIIRLLAA
jgi:hypothetical protein